MGQMPPLDDVNGDRVLAEFEAMIRDTAGADARPGAPGEGRGLVPERRAVNWVNALAALSREIEQRQGSRRAEILLRTVGSRMCRELLTPPPNSIDSFEPAINRALSILDWGWVAVLDRQDAIVFEHRVPWPFEKRLEHLPFVLEGFYSDLLQRLGDNAAMPVRLTGQQGGGLQFQWSPTAAASPATAAPASIMMPAPTMEADDPMERQEPWLGEPPALASAPEPRLARNNPDAPVVKARRARPGRMRALTLVAATVLVALFAAGTIGGANIGDWAQHFRAPSASGTPTATASIEDRATAGDTDAQIRLGLQLANGAAAKPDYGAAARWFQVAAKAGSLEAQYDLAVMTADGLGVKRDLGRAAVLFMSAAAGGLPQAEYRVGVACQYGRGVPRSLPFAAMWYDRAARHGVSAAQTALAAMYASGGGVPADPVMAFAWYRVAEQQGDRAASAKRIELYSEMNVTQRAAAMAEAKILLGTVNSPGGRIPEPAHPTVDTLIAQAS